MSDYLWDKTGEADAEVERLEALLGSFAHTPRPLELPATTEAVAATAEPRRPALPVGARRFRWPRLFAPAGLAAAAAVLLALFVGAALWLRGTTDDGGGQAASRRSRPSAQKEAAPSKSDPSRSEQARSAQTPEPSAPEPSAKEAGATEPQPGAPATASRAREAGRASVEGKGGAAEVKTAAAEVKTAAAEAKTTAAEVRTAAAEAKDERGAVGNLARAALRRRDARVAAAAQGRRAKAEPAAREDAGQAFTPEAMRGGGASALVENARLLTKEQLLYALRLTGAKLRDVRQRAQGFDGAQPPLR